MKTQRSVTPIPEDSMSSSGILRLQTCTKYIVTDAGKHPYIYHKAIICKKKERERERSDC